MASQGKSYIATNINTTPERYITGNNRLGDRAITSNIIDGKRYFSSIDAEIYIGGANSSYIDDIVQISWSVEQATMPLYGYNSYTFDDLAVGIRQITGSFIINFTKSGYLYDILRKTEGVNRASFYENLPSDNNLIWTSNFHKEHTASWDKSFNILIGYGDYNKNSDKTTLILLHCVQLTGCQQVLGADGSPIAEAYSFIAKDIRYEVSGIPDNDEAPIPDDDEKEKEEEFYFNTNSIILTRTTIKHRYTPQISNSYSFSILETSYKNGKPIFTQVKLLSSDTSELTKTYITIPFGSNESFKITGEEVALIEMEINKQLRLNVPEDSLYMYCDLIVDYSKGNPDERFQYYLNKKKVKIKIINTLI